MRRLQDYFYVMYIYTLHHLSGQREDVLQLVGHELNQSVPQHSS